MKNQVKKLNMNPLFSLDGIEPLFQKSLIRLCTLFLTGSEQVKI